MKRYRIVKHILFGKEEYEVQKRFLGFLWWYNFNNIDGNTTGIYDSFKEAELAIRRKRFKSYKETVSYYD